MSIVIAAACVMGITGKRVAGRASLSPGQALVVTKFCFDYNTACTTECPSPEENPGMLHLTAFSGKRSAAPASADDEEEEDESTATATLAKKGLSEFYFALLDDEYFSFPEVSQVWGEANCSDVLKAAKRSFPLKWDQLQSEGGIEVESALIEHLRPRWWYVAIVSCSKSSLEVSYQMHLENKLRGLEVEFSMDQRGTFMVTLLTCVAFAGLVAVQSMSMHRWRTITRRNRWDEVHPAILMLSASTALAFAGQVATFVYYWYFQQSGEAPDRWAVAGKASVISSKTLISSLLMLLAHGECVCSPIVSWTRHREVAGGMALYGCLQFPLELWGESEYRNSTTEYIYDTRPGVVLVAFDVLWMWMYLSRSVQTYKGETRVKSRRFYKRYGPAFFLWFASLPCLALVARTLAAHIRLCITSSVTVFVHVGTLSILVYTFRPSVAVDLYDIKESICEVAHNDEELASMLGSFNGDDDVI
jgi:hypothetical protein